MGTSDDDGSYKDGIESASSVLLLSTGIVALLISVHIALSIHHYGTKSASSKLVFMINCAQGMAILSKLPFVFNNIPYGCIISQFMLIYAFSQLWLVSYMMLLCTNHLKLNIQSAVYSSSDLGLNKKYELFLYLFPFVPIILPLSANAFEDKYNWCVTDTRMHNGEPWMLVQVVVFMIVIFTLMGRQCWVIYKSTQEFAHLIPPKIILRRILKGPFIYALVTILFGFVGVVLVRAGSNFHDSTQKSYYINYAIIYLFFGPAYANFFIFFVEKRHLKVFESQVAEVKEFETVFDFENLSDDEDVYDSGLDAMFSPSECESDSSRSSALSKLSKNSNKHKTVNALTSPLFDFEENGF